MDDKEVLFRLRNSYYLGNYTQVIDIWKETITNSISLSAHIEEDVNTIIQRTILFFLQNNKQTITSNQILFNNYKMSMNVYVEF